MWRIMRLVLPILALLPRRLHGAGVTIFKGAEAVAREYDPNMAKAMAALAKLVYCGELNGTSSAILKSTSGPMRKVGLELSNPVLVTQGDLGDPRADFAVVARLQRVSASSSERQGCVVAFRGTDNAANNVENERQTLESWESNESEVCEGCQVCKGCKVFAGYKVIWQELRQVVLLSLKGLDCQRGDPITLTGHSLGAGMMTLAMYDLKSREGYDVQLSYNFASPRVGNLAFAESFSRLFGRNVVLFRITHARDAVPHYPLHDGYVHVGHQVWYRTLDPEEYLICSNFTESPSCGNDAIDEDHLCPLAPSECKGSYCVKHCEFPPAGGPHCQSPLAPANNFCNFGSSLKDIKQEFARSCIFGAQVMTYSSTTTVTTTVTTTTSTTTASCAEEGMSYIPLDLLGTMETLEDSADDCKARCLAIDECAYYSFYSPLKNCHVTGAQATLMSGSLGFISGPKVCSQTDIEAKFLRRHPVAEGFSTRIHVVSLLAASSALAAAVAAAAVRWSGAQPAASWRRLPRGARSLVGARGDLLVDAYESVDDASLGGR